MKIEYEHIETSKRRYTGVSVEVEECRIHLLGAVKDNLLDTDETKHALETLRTLGADTGFRESEALYADIQALEDMRADVQTFRIGEAYAEVVLEQEFGCRFHWNENRDARNPKGNKTGADLVGFIEMDEEVRFLFGEVKTSSETATRPPQVMTSRGGLESQLKDLHTNKNKRSMLIQYLSSKSRHYPIDHPFRSDFDKSVRSYYSIDKGFQLAGVLIRDVTPDESDVSSSFLRLKEHIIEPNGLKLLALYLPFQKEEWLKIMNGAQ